VLVDDRQRRPRTDQLGDEIDLRGLAFTSGASKSVLDTKRHQRCGGGGTLALLGQYSQGSFSATSDGNPGTLITDPPYYCRDSDHHVHGVWGIVALASSIQMPTLRQTAWKST
jgi:hypothetical protein